MAVAWNPAKYLAFGKHRLQPALDLIARLPAADSLHGPIRSIVDLGCGPGNIFPWLVERFRPTLTSLVGLDNSPEMIEAGARMIAELRAGGAVHADVELSMQQGDMESFRPARPVDLLFSNAALHWAPDHEHLFPHLVAQHIVRPGGWLAVQMPDTREQPSHTSMLAVARECGFGEQIHNVSIPSTRLAAAEYLRLLAPLCASVEMWRTTYYQVLTGPSPVAAFTRQTGLLAVLNALETDEQRAVFEAAYAARMAELYPPEPDGTTLFPFSRFFLLAQTRS